jgi:VWFA-related protein
MQAPAVLHVSPSKGTMRALRFYTVAAFIAAGCTVSSSGAVASRSEPAGAAAQATAPHGTTWLIFLDDMHLDFRNTGHLRDLLETIASELIHDGDEFGIRCSNPSSRSLDFTSDRRLLEAALRKTNGVGLKAADILLNPDDALTAREVRYRATVALAAARETMTPPARGRRKAVIYISNGHSLGLAAARFLDQLSELTRIASRSRITIFAIEPRRLPDALTRVPNVDAVAWDNYWTTTRNSLRILSEPTGGFTLVDGPDLVEGLELISRAMRNDPSF